MSEELTYVQKLEKDYLRLEAENDRYKQALEYYANNHTWHIDKINEVARKALEGSE